MSAKHQKGIKNRNHETAYVFSQTY